MRLAAVRIAISLVPQACGRWPRPISATACSSTRWAEARNDRVPDLVAELIRSDSKSGYGLPRRGTIDGVQANRMMPIVSVGASDLVALRICRCLARPDGNVAGLVHMELPTPPLHFCRN